MVETSLKLLSLVRSRPRAHHHLRNILCIPPTCLPSSLEYRSSIQSQLQGGESGVYGTSVSGTRKTFSPYQSYQPPSGPAGNISRNIEDSPKERSQSRNTIYSRPRTSVHCPALISDIHGIGLISEKSWSRRGLSQWIQHPDALSAA